MRTRALLDAARHDGTATGDRKDILDRHQVVALDRALRHRDILVQGPGQLANRLPVRRIIGLEGLERAPANDRDVVAGELVIRQQLSNLELDEFEEFLVVQHVHLVEEDHDAGHADLAGKQNVLARLGLRAVRGGNQKHRTVHLRRAGDHVLDVVRVARAVHVGVVPRLGFVLHMGGRDRDAALPFLGSVVDRIEAAELSAGFGGEDLRDCRGQGRLAVIHMTDGPHIDMGFGAFKLRLGHLRCSLSCWTCRIRFVLRSDLPVSDQSARRTTGKWSPRPGLNR